MKELLNSMDSVEFSQWMAFERAHGPLQGEWERETMAQMIEHLNTISYLISQAKFTDKTHRRGPIPKPERYPRPSDSIRRLGESSPLDDVDKDEAEWLPPTEDELLDIRIDPIETGEEE